MGSTKTRLQTTRRKRAAGRKTDVADPEQHPPTDPALSNIVDAGIVFDAGEIVGSDRLSEADRLELEQVGAIVVAGWHSFPEATDPVSTCVEAPDAPPGRRYRRAVTFDGDIAFVAFVTPDIESDEFTDIARDRLAAWTCGTADAGR